MNQHTESGEFTIAIILAGSILFYYLYYYTAHSQFLKNKLNIRNKVTSEIRIFLLKKIIGLLFLGVIPGIIYYGFLRPEYKLLEFFQGSVSSILITTLVLTFIIGIFVFVNQKANVNRNSLQMDIDEWTVNLFFINITGWTLYLLGYEFLFRGILLFECENSFGFWPAIAINMVIYSAIHMVNGKAEALGAVVFGTVACYFALTQRNILIPVFMHVALSISSDYFSIKLNKNLKFVNSVSS